MMKNVCFVQKRMRFACFDKDTFFQSLLSILGGFEMAHLDDFIKGIIDGRIATRSFSQG